MTRSARTDLASIAICALLGLVISFGAGFGMYAYESSPTDLLQPFFLLRAMAYDAIVGAIFIGPFVMPIALICGVVGVALPTSAFGRWLTAIPIARGLIICYVIGLVLGILLSVVAGGPPPL
jgi:hypothetical protein